MEADSRGWVPASIALCLSSRGAERQLALRWGEATAGPAVCAREDLE